VAHSTRTPCHGPARAVYRHCPVGSPRLWPSVSAGTTTVLAVTYGFRGTLRAPHDGRSAGERCGSTGLRVPHCTSVSLIVTLPIRLAADYRPAT
jgi:hypothetical protein